MSAPTKRGSMSERDIEDIAWGFLRSEFTHPVYADWTLDRRIDTYLSHRGLARAVDDANAYGRVTERIMANVRHARSCGALGCAKDSV